MGIPFPQGRSSAIPAESMSGRPAGKGIAAARALSPAQTCGEPLLAPPDPAAGGEPAAPVLDYTSGSFADFMAGDEPDPDGASAGGPRADGTKAAGPGLTGPSRPGRG